MLEGIEKTLRPHPLNDPWVSYAVLALGVVFEGATWVVALRAFRVGKGRRRWLGAIRSSKDPTVFTVLVEDTAALLGLSVAAAGSAAGQILDLRVMDGVASVVIGLLLAVTASFLAYESQRRATQHPNRLSSGGKSDEYPPSLESRTAAASDSGVAGHARRGRPKGERGPACRH